MIVRSVKAMVFGANHGWTDTLTVTVPTKNTIAQCSVSSIISDDFISGGGVTIGNTNPQTSGEFGSARFIPNCKSVNFDTFSYQGSLVEGSGLVFISP